MASVDEAQNRSQLSNDLRVWNLKVVNFKFIPNFFFVLTRSINHFPTSHFACSTIPSANAFISFNIALITQWLRRIQHSDLTQFDVDVHWISQLRQRVMVEAVSAGVIMSSVECGMRGRKSFPSATDREFNLNFERNFDDYFGVFLVASMAEHAQNQIVWQVLMTLHTVDVHLGMIDLSDIQLSSTTSSLDRISFVLMTLLVN